MSNDRLSVVDQLRAVISNFPQHNSVDGNAYYKITGRVVEAALSHIASLEADKERLRRSVEPVCRAVSWPDIHALADKRGVLLRDFDADSFEDWNCGGFTLGDLRNIARAYWHGRDDAPMEFRAALSPTAESGKPEAHADHVIPAIEMIDRANVPEKPGGSERSPADFSREFAGYLANYAEYYMEVLDRSAFTVARGNEALRDELTDARRGLASAIYEWRKRDARVTSAPSPGGDDKEGWRPIETAPKDDLTGLQPKCDLWLNIPASLRSFGFSDAFRVPDCWIAMAGRNEGKWVHDVNGTECAMEEAYITHWMPFPPTPSSTDKEGGEHG